MALVREVRDVASGWRWGKRPLVPRSAEPFALRKESREFPTSWARTPLAQATRDAIQRYALKPLVWNETRVRVEGLDVLADLQPPVIFVSNHSSHLDAPLMLCSLPPALRFFCLLSSSRIRWSCSVLESLNCSKRPQRE